jgi:serine/threonine protein kinase
MSREYRFVELIGEGSYGKVYKAVHLASGKTVAVKILNCAE